VEGLQVDTQALHVHVAHAEAAQFVGHHQARRQHPVEIAIEFAHIGFDIRCEPVTHAVAHQQWQVGVVEADHWHVQFAPGFQRRPGSQVRVADFDQVGLEVAQHVAPGRQAHREAVAVAERQGRCRDLVDAIGMAGAGAGDQKAVAYARKRVEAMVFGVEVSPHAAAGRGVEHGDVGDVHDQHPSGIVFGFVIWR